MVCYAGGANGRLFLEQLAREGIACDPVPIAAETRLCTTFADADGRCTEVIEPAPEVTAAERSAFRALVEERLAAARVLVLMGTPVRGETPDCYRWLVRAAHEHGVPVVMDSAGPTALEALAERPEVLKVNAEELAQLRGTFGRRRGVRAPRRTACCGNAACAGSSSPSAPTGWRPATGG